MNKALFTGSGVAIVTPFSKDGVNYQKLGELIDFQINNSTDAIVVCGTTGESSTMPDDEHMAVIKYTVEKVNKRVPVIAGTGSNDTKHAVELSSEAEKVGADGLLIVTPYYNKASDSGVIKHYEIIADKVNIPIILYNVPSRTGLNLKPSVVKILSEHKNIAAIKQASDNIVQMAQIASLCGDDFVIYSGNDDMILPSLALGAKGVISVLANVLPKETHDMVQFYLDGEVEKSRKLQLELLDIISDLFIEVNPIPVKAALNLLGFDVGGTRMPLCDISGENMAKLKGSLEKYGLNVKAV